MIIKTNTDEIQNYLTDASNLKGYCDKVYIPENIDEISELITELYNSEIPYTISSAGTGLVGGRVPFGGVLISTEKLNRIIEIETKSNIITLECGVPYYEMESAVGEFDLFFPPNPTEKNAFVGSNIACNSSGSRTFKYGTYRNYIEELTVILPNGEILNLSRTESERVHKTFRLETKTGINIHFDIPKIPYPNLTKNSAGYFLKEGMHRLDLFVGCEGTLGTIVKARLKLLPKPEKVFGATIFFDDINRAFDFIEDIRNKSYQSFGLSNNKDAVISTRLIEFFDKNSLDLLRNDYPQIPIDARCAIWIEQEHTSQQEEKVMELWYSTITHYTKLAEDTWVATNEAEHNRFREFRHTLPMRIYELLAKYNICKVGSDSAVPDSSFRNFYFQFVEQLEKHNLLYYIWGHFGNSHLHANIIPRNPQEEELANKIYYDHIELALKFGGTYSAEHGTGKLKKAFLQKMYGNEAIEQMKQIKKFFDPKNLVGRNNIFEI